MIREIINFTILYFSVLFLIVWLLVVIQETKGDNNE
jgi:large-conductance mechanosensitive channel